MTTEENKAVVRRLVEEVINNRNLDLVDGLIAPNYEYHDPAQPMRGPQGFKDLMTSYFTAFPDLQFAIEDMIAEGDKVVSRWTARGTHRGELMGIAPTGKLVTVTGIVISRIANGKFVDDWESLDALGMLEQIGAAPTTAPAG